MPSEPRAPASCAQCGTDLVPSARACPECGADERTGWRENAIHDGLDLPDHAWEDERSEAPRPTARVNGLSWYWWLCGVGLLLLLLLSLVGVRP
jgi:hypothetical protein